MARPFSLPSSSAQQSEPKLVRITPLKMQCPEIEEIQRHARLSIVKRCTDPRMQLSTLHNAQPASVLQETCFVMMRSPMTDATRSSRIMRVLCTTHRGFARLTLKRLALALPRSASDLLPRRSSALSLYALGWPCHLPLQKLKYHFGWHKHSRLSSMPFGDLLVTIYPSATCPSSWASCLCCFKSKGPFRLNIHKKPTKKNEEPYFRGDKAPNRLWPTG